MFCYTLSARAIGATVSAGALHAQGWGFESLIAHHLIEEAPSDGGLSFFGHITWDSNPQGCGAEETRKRFPAQHARSEAWATKYAPGEYLCAKNAKYEYCYYFSNSDFETSEGRTGTKAPIDRTNQRSIWP